MEKETPDVREARKALDHLLLGIADLDRGIEWVVEKTAVRATMGGSHPGVGTRNALLSLSNLQYVEIISIDPMQKQTGRTASLVQNLTAPRLIAWAASTNDIDAVVQRAQSAGYEIDGPSSGERVKPDGGILKWRTVRIISEFGDVIPFFIEWNAAIKHPSLDSPSGCSLDTFEIEHPRADQVQSMLSEFGIRAAVKRGNKPRLKATLSTPKGKAEL